MADIIKKLKDFANSDDAANVVGAGTELFEHLLKKKEEGSVDHLLTGDKFTDESILRGKAVADDIKAKWDVDLGTALEFVYMVVEAGVKLSGIITS
jgi:hypothetical protein